MLWRLANVHVLTGLLLRVFSSAGQQVLYLFPFFHVCGEGWDLNSFKANVLAVRLLSVAAGVSFSRPFCILTAVWSPGLHCASWTSAAVYCPPVSHYYD